jgi:polyhydroxybutyrate depolymerase
MEEQLRGAPVGRVPAHPRDTASAEPARTSVRRPGRGGASTARITLFGLVGLTLAACGPVPAPLGQVDYAALALPFQCAPGARTGPAGQDDSLSTPAGIRLGVRTPRNYDATRAHPLLVVFAPAGHGRVRSEQLAGLTQAATARGFIVAYADHRRLARPTFDELGRIPALVAARWCIDTRRIYIAGHSDGGASAAAVGFLGTSSLPPAALIVSGAGIRAEDLTQYACPEPLSVMLIHSREDELFPPPAFGYGPSQWWAACNRCAPQTRPAAEGCVEYAGCAQGARTLYCEAAGPHSNWPGLNGTMLDFLSGQTP